ncbi:MAG: response regulator transcription factor [Alphaproteobacteria bacterium]
MPLSNQEIAVLKAVAAGKVGKQIAHELGITPGTVEDHIENARTKLGARNRAEAIVQAIAQGYLPGPSVEPFAKHVISSDPLGENL